MMRLSRLLPLVAVASVGVLAIDALENGPGMFGAARAFAEQLAHGGEAHKGDADADASASDAANSAIPADASAQDASAIAPKPAPVCAPSPTQLAQEAGLSPAELQVLQSLGARRDALDQRAQGLDTQVSLIAAAEAKVDARIAAMNQTKADITAMLGQLDDKQQAEVNRLVKVFEAMKPADAAARFTLLSDDVRLPIAAQMKERVLSAMLAKMAPLEAKRLTESLAARYAAQEAAARAAMTPNPPPPAQAAAPPPNQTAQAGPAPAAAAAPPPKPHHKPKPAHHPPSPTAQASAAPPAAPPAKGQASASAAPAAAPPAPAPKPAPAGAAPAGATPAGPAPPAKSG